MIFLFCDVHSISFLLFSLTAFMSESSDKTTCIPYMTYMECHKLQFCNTSVSAVFMLIMPGYLITLCGILLCTIW